MLLEVQRRVDQVAQSGRCVYRTHDVVVDAIDAYVEHRWVRGLGSEFDRKRFRGSSPSTPLVLTHKGSGFELQAKRRTLVGGEPSLPRAQCRARARLQPITGGRRGGGRYVSRQAITGVSRACHRRSRRRIR
jgi:hypothetical protein